MSTEIWKPVDHETAVSLIGEGVHKGIRKGSEDPTGLWKAISDSGETWGEGIDFFVYWLEQHMGMALCEKTEAIDEDGALSIARQVYARESPLKSDPAVARMLDEVALAVLARAGSTKGTETEVESPPVLSKVTEDLPEDSYVVDARDIMWKRGEEKWWSGGDSPSSPKDFDRMLFVYGPLRLIRVGGQP